VSVAIEWDTQPGEQGEEEFVGRFESGVGFARFDRLQGRDDPRIMNQSSQSSY
jgi:hypothetical protein